MKEEFLHRKIQERKEQNAFRELRLPTGRIDFCSNDYLGIVKNNLIIIDKYTDSGKNFHHGSTGSRLLAGNYSLIEETERLIAKFHDAEAGLIFNSGYDANIGLLSCVPQRGDTIIYDYLCHASIRDGIRLSFAQSFSFQHNDLDDLQKKLTQATGNIFIVTESVFSMDGDKALLEEMVALCLVHGAHLIVDEAHATGVIGNRGEGLLQHLGLQQKCFARIHTFGKALGCHGAIILGSESLRHYLINFCRPFIYTTSLPELSVMAIKKGYELIPGMEKERLYLQQLSFVFQNSLTGFQRLKSDTPIQGIIVPGNEQIKKLAFQLQQENLDVRPILYPTVPKGGERLRIVLHAFNTEPEVHQLIELLANLKV